MRIQKHLITETVSSVLNRNLIAVYLTYTTLGDHMYVRYALFLSNESRHSGIIPFSSKIKNNFKFCMDQRQRRNGRPTHTAHCINKITVSFVVWLLLLVLLQYYILYSVLLVPCAPCAHVPCAATIPALNPICLPIYFPYVTTTVSER